MGKGGSSQPTEQTVTQTTLPDYAQPYVERLFERAETESQRAYEPYGGGRIAQFTDTGERGMAGMENLGPGITGLNDAMYGTQRAGDMARSYAAMGPGQYSQFQYNPTTQYGGGLASQMIGNDVGMASGAFGPSGPNQYGFADARQFTDEASQYMSPYMQNVVDVQKDQAQLDFNRAQSGRDATAVQRGAYGGSRSAVVDALAQEDLARTMGEIQASGQQSAYQDAQRTFQNDRAAQMQREAERAAEFGRTQGMGMEDYYGMLDTRMQGRGMGFDVLGRQAQEQLTREQAQAGELGRVQSSYDDSRLRAAQLGLEGIGTDLLSQEQLANMGGTEREAALDYYDTLMGVGDTQRQLEQMYLDQDYQDFLAQQSYPYEQLQQYSNLLRGNTVGSTVRQSQIQQANPWKDLLGGGISALSLSQALGGST